MSETKNAISPEARIAIDFLNSRGYFYKDPNPMRLIPDGQTSFDPHSFERIQDAFSKPVKPASFTEIAGAYTKLQSNGIINITRLQESDIAQNRRLTVEYRRNNEFYTEEYDRSGRIVHWGNDTTHILLTYTNDGYVTQIKQWQDNGVGHVDAFNYEENPPGKRAARLTRRLFSGLGNNMPSDILGPPITIDLSTGKYVSEESRTPIQTIERTDIQHTFSSVKQIDRYSGIICHNGDDILNALLTFGFERQGIDLHTDSRTASLGAELAYAFNNFQSDRNGILWNIRSIMSAIAPDEMPEQIQNAEAPFNSRTLLSPKGEQTSDTSIKFSFDYDGFGGFHKSFITIHTLPTATVLELQRSVFGQETEENIATNLQLERRFVSSSLSFETAIDSREVYALDIDKILITTLKALDVTLEDENMFVSELRERLFHDLLSFIGGVSYVDIPLTSFDLHLQLMVFGDALKAIKNDPTTSEIVHLEEGILRGYALPDWFDEHKREVPTLSLSLILPKSKIASDEEKNTVMSAAQSIRAALQQL